MTPPLTSPQAYRENTVLSASPAQRVVMLYDGAQRFLRQATSAMHAREVERAHNALHRVELIVAHLDTVLDYDQDPRLAAQLSAVYNFCLGHLRRARFEQDPAKVAEVAGLLAELRESWAQIAGE